jgi:hypothetical protein
VQNAYNPATGEPLGLQVIEQRTNLLTYSEQFDDASWTKFSSTVTDNAIESPNGTLTSDKLVESTSNERHFIFKNTTVTVGVSYTLSVFLKSAGRSDVVLRFGGSGLNDQGANFDLSSGTVGTIWNGATTTDIKDVGNGWFRCLVTATANLTGVGGFYLSVNNSASLNQNGVTYIGDGVSGVYLWGAQLEAGAFPTPYIKTEATSATRNASVAVINDIDESEWWNPNQWQIDIRYIANRAGNNALTPFEFYTDDNNRFSPYHLTSGRISFISRNAGVSTLLSNTTLPIISAGDAVNLSVRYDGSILYLSYNGSAEISYAVTLASVDKLIIGVNRAVVAATCINGHIAQLIYTPSAGV